MRSSTPDAGPSWSWAEAARLVAGGRVVGLDASRERLAAAREGCTRAGLTGVAFHEARLHGPGAAGLPGASFDHVWTRFFLEYQPDPLAVTREPEPAPSRPG